MTNSCKLVHFFVLSITLYLSFFAWSLYSTSIKWENQLWLIESCIYKKVSNTEQWKVYVYTCFRWLFGDCHRARMRLNRAWGSYCQATLFSSCNLAPNYCYYSPNERDEDKGSFWRKETEQEVWRRTVYWVSPFICLWLLWKIEK